MTETCRHPSRKQCHKILVWLALFVVVSTGCSRDRYRQQADQQAYQLIGQNTQDPRWPLPDYNVYANPISRMASPYSPDFPPMPPDDPSAHRYMTYVDGMKGYPHWDENGCTPYVENPDWLAFIAVDDEGNIPLDMLAAIKMALLQSPVYQQQLETLYLSALDVSFEQFRFDTQFFGGYEAFFTSDGPDRAGGSSSELRLATRDIQMRKVFASGGELVVGLANTLIWEFSGPDRHTATTLLDFSLVQPLLRFGGRARVLEELTLAERTLLADVRALERFRRGFYAQISTGLNSDSGVGRQQGGGYLGILQTAQVLRNQEGNVASLQNSLASLQARYNAGGRVDFFQVEFARQALFNAQSALLTSRTAFQTSLDRFKLDLGLPPDTPLVLNDKMLDPFRLLDPRLSAAQEDITELLNHVRDPELALNAATWGELVNRTATLTADNKRFVELVKADLETLHNKLPKRMESLRQLAAEPEVQSGQLQSEPFDVDRLQENAELADDTFTKYATRLAELGTALSEVAGPDQRNQLAKLLNQTALTLQDLALLQARIRLETIDLVPIDVEPHVAIDVARSNRRDWMNARASLVDAWRQIKFTANALKSNLNLLFSGDLGNTGDNPLRLRGTTGRLRVGVEFDAPLTRLIERNDYRISLIAYEQSRRSFYTFGDNVYQQLRQTLRDIRLNQLNFEMRRAAVQLAISQVELARLQLEEPPKPGAVSQAGTDNRVQNLVNALNQLLAAQNDVLGIWVDYEVLRLALDFQLGTMQLDREGLWIDPGPIDLDSNPEEIAPPSPAEPLDEEAPAPLPLFPVEGGDVRLMDQVEGFLSEWITESDHSPPLIAQDPNSR